MKRLIAAVLVSVACAAPALAQLRSIPEDAVRGEIRHLQEMDVHIDGKPERLAPGAQIHDAFNRLVLPVAIPSGVHVKYVRDSQGLVQRVWILTPEEAAQPAKR